MGPDGNPLLDLAVSILAHPERWGATPFYLRKQWIIGMFQSSPTPKGGRYDGTTVAPAGTLLFQSSPTPKGGRYNRRHAILSLRRPSFNPRPPRKVGATGCPGR